jgi:nucleoporin POM152
LSSKSFSKTFHHSREEIDFEQEKDGTYEYIFERLDDRDYKGIVRLGENGEGVMKRQVIHPLGTARVKGGNRKRKVWSCDGKEVDLEIDLVGTGPWNLDYSIGGDGSSKPKTSTIKGITSPTHTIKVPIPSRVAKSGGNFVITLENVEDGRGCKRSLIGEDVEYEVVRSKPTARFYGGGEVGKGGKEITVRMGETATLPLRLTGDRPWKVSYSHISSEDIKIYKATLNNPNDEIQVTKQGLYRLEDVKDSHCVGEIGRENEFKVTYLSIPTLTFAKDQHGTELIKDVGKFGVQWKLKEGNGEACQGAERMIQLVFKGRFFLIFFASFCNRLN